MGLLQILMKKYFAPFIMKKWVRPAVVSQNISNYHQQQQQQTVKLSKTSLCFAKVICTLIHFTNWALWKWNKFEYIITVNFSGSPVGIISFIERGLVLPFPFKDRGFKGGLKGWRFVVSTSKVSQYMPLI